MKIKTNGQNRKDIYRGLKVYIVLKKDQPTGILTRGVVKDILTNISVHPRGIKVRLTDGQVGRCQYILKNPIICPKCNQESLIVDINNIGFCLDCGFKCKIEE